MIGRDIGSRNDFSVGVVLDATEERIAVANYVRIKDDYPQIQSTIQDLHRAFAASSFTVIEQQSINFHPSLKQLESELRDYQLPERTSSKTRSSRWRSRSMTHPRRELAGVGDLVLQKRSDSSTHVYHLFIIETEHRDTRENTFPREVSRPVSGPDPSPGGTAISVWEPGPPHAERLPRQSLSRCSWS